MAFNRNQFSSKAMKKEVAAQTSLADGKAPSNGGSSRKWYKLVNGIKDYSEILNKMKKGEHGTKVAVNVLPFMSKLGPKFMWHDNVHQIPDASGKSTNHFRCPGKMTCEACKMKAQLDDGENYDMLKKGGYVPKKRTLMLVNPVGTDDVYVLETATANKGTALPEMLMAAARDMSEDNSVIDFASLDEGMQVIISWKKQVYNLHEYMAPSTIQFKDRTEEISDEILNKIPDTIEDMFNWDEHSLDEMKTCLNGGEKVEEENAEEPKEDEKQEDFESMMTSKKEEPKPAQAEEEFLTEDDFKRDPYAKAPAPKPAEAFACPNGFDIASEFGTHRQCMRCPHADKCEKFCG